MLGVAVAPLRALPKANGVAPVAPVAAVPAVGPVAGVGAVAGVNAAELEAGARLPNEK